MQYRAFGRTGLSMPVFSCGGMRYQHAWQDKPWNEIPDENQINLEKTIRRALEVGIHHIETARGYGSSEMQLGKILPTIPRESMIVQTKVTPSENAHEFEKNFECSMSYLKLDYVDLLSVHGINTEKELDWTMRSGGCLEVAHRLQRQGRCRYIGFSTHAAQSVILKAILTNAFDYVNLHWYFIFQENWKAIEAARERNMGVFIISPNDKGGMLYRPTSVLTELCSPLSPMVFNDLFCLDRPEIHTLSLGAARPEDFDEHVNGLHHLANASSLLPPIISKLKSRIATTCGDDWYDQYLNDIPEWDQVPGNINLRVILRLWTLGKAFDMLDYGKMRYNLLGNGGAWFPGLPAESFDPNAILKVTEKNPFSRHIPDILRQSHEWFKGEPKKRLSQSD